VTLPEGGLSLKELNRLGMFLYPYCNDVETGPSIWTQLNH
jgi:hypothetical protein